MNKSEVAAIISKRIGLSQKDTKEVVNAILDSICEALIKGGRLEIRGLGTFEVKRRSSRVGRDILKNKKVLIPPRKAVIFTPGKVFKRLVNQ